MAWLRLPLRDLGHTQRGDRLPVAAPAAVVLPSLLLVDEDLPGATLRDDLGPDPHPFDERGADPHRSVVGGEQHLGELDGRAHLTHKSLDPDDLPGRDPVLLSPGADDGVRHETISARLVLPR